MTTEMQLLASAKQIDHVTVFIAPPYHVRNQLPFPARRRLPLQSAFIGCLAGVTAVLGQSVR